jgi:hypothetical protein
MFAALVAPSDAMVRLDQALAGYPLRQAFLQRPRLNAARRPAAVGGALIDPWHPAACLEGPRLRMDPYADAGYGVWSPNAARSRLR